MQQHVRPFQGEKNSLTAYHFLETISLSIMFCTLVLPREWMSAGVYVFIAINIYKYFKYKPTQIKFDLQQRRILLLFGLYYVIHIVSIIWSVDAWRGYKELEAKVYWIIIPAAFVLFKVTNANVKTVLKTYVYTVTILVLACFGIAIYWAFFYGDFQTWPFKYYNFTFWVDFHPSYLAMLILMSIACCGYLIHRFGTNVLLYVMLSFQIFSLVFIGSRFGILALVLISAFLMFQVANPKVKKRVSLAAILVLILLGGSGYYLSMNTSSRLLGSKEAIEDRLKLFNVATDLIQNKPLLGYGIGSDIPILLQAYEKRGLVDAFEQKYNVHNQYLQTLMDTGIVGLIPFAILLFAIFKYCQSSWLATSILLVFVLFFVVESVLETQRGIVPFAAWLSFFCFIKTNVKIVTTD